MEWLNLPDVDAPRIAQGTVFAWEWANTFWNVSTMYVWGTILSSAILAALVLLNYDIIVKRMDWGGSRVSSFWHRYVVSFWEKRTMKRKRKALIEVSLREAIISHIEKCRDLHGSAPINLEPRLFENGCVPITNKEADELYAKCVKIFPDLKYAIDSLKPQETTPEAVKAAISERRQNEARDAEGKVIPAPIPGDPPPAFKTNKWEEPAKKKDSIIVFRTRTPATA